MACPVRTLSLQQPVPWAELPLILAERGRKVTVIEEGPRFGKGLTLVRRLRLIPELEEHGVTLHAEARDIAITRDGVTFSAADGSMRRVAADNVIIAKGARSDSTLADALRAAGLTVTEIGDGTGVGYLEGAVRGAAHRTDLFQTEDSRALSERDLSRAARLWRRRRRAHLFRQAA